MYFHRLFPKHFIHRKNHSRLLIYSTYQGKNIPLGTVQLKQLQYFKALFKHGTIIRTYYIVPWFQDALVLGSRQSFRVGLFTAMLNDLPPLTIFKEITSTLV